MRYRALDPLGDMQVGKPFLVDSPECVAQAVLTRLKLWRAEWFVDTSDGTPYLEEVLGERTTPEVAIKQRILRTPGVTAITAFSATYAGDNREITLSAAIDTLYGPATISQVL